MANPSLQIGNSNWAIKEDNLLGYSTAGTRFVPQPITMTRESAGTRVNSSGLVETVELLGSEEITNEDFTQLPLGTGWDAYSSGTSTVAFTEGAVLSIDGSNSNVGVYQQNIFTSGVQYKIVVSVKATASFDALVSETDAASSKGTIGTLNLTTSYQDFSFYYTGTGAWDLFIHRKYGETAGQNQQIYVKSVSVKESTKNNLARVDYDGTASSLLVEPMRTNLLPYSSDFSQWGDGNVVIESGYSSPDGENNAYKITNGATDGLIYLSGYSNTNDARSIYARTVSGTGTAQLLSHNANTNNTFTLTEEWQRFEVNQTSNVVTVFYGVDFRGSGTLEEVLIWGAQTEVGSYPTSLIPTNGEAGGVTRNQDQYSKTGISNLINSEEGVLFLEASTFENGADCRITLSDGTITNRVSIEWDILANTIKGFVGSNGNLVSPATYNQTDYNKIAIKYKENDCTFWINGTEVDTDFTVSVLSGVNQLEFSNYGGTVPFEGKVKQLQVFKTALTDSELIALTT